MDRKLKFDFRIYIIDEYKLIFKSSSPSKNGLEPVIKNPGLGLLLHEIILLYFILLIDSLAFGPGVSPQDILLLFGQINIMALIYSLRNRLSSDFKIKHIDVLLFVVLFEEVHDGFVGGFLG